MVQSTNTIANDIKASIAGSTVTSTGGFVKVWADSTADVKKTENGAVSVAIAISGAGANQKATGTIEGNVEASIGAGSKIDAHGEARSEATSSSHVSVHLFGGDGSAIAGHDSTTTGDDQPLDAAASSHRARRSRPTRWRSRPTRRR